MVIKEAESNTQINTQPGIMVRDQIISYLSEGKMCFTPPLDSLQLQQHAIDLRLGYTFKIPQIVRMTARGREATDIEKLGEEPEYQVVELEEGQFFDLLPKESVLATTLEKIRMPDDHMAILFPRSSVNRRGLAVEMTGIIDAGYCGSLTIPVTNKTDQIKRVLPGQRFCQIVFFPLSCPAALIQSRWHNRSFLVGSLPERSSEEQDLISQGNITELKARFALDLSSPSNHG